MKADLLDRTPESQAPGTTETGGLSLFERMASDPNASVEKIERLMALWERNEARKAETAFNAEMSDAQAEMRPVSADATNPQTRSKYASYEALDLALRPIYTKHGFGLSFDTGDSPLEDHVRVLCYASQRAGHSRTYHIDMPADGKGAKGGDVMTKTHAVGSGVSYGMRYLLKMIFNVAVGEDDDDGNRAGRNKPEPAMPSGFEDWLTDMTACADEGTAKLQVAWAKSKLAFREHLTRHAPETWSKLKVKAAKVGA